jgi:RimJ/RimL family protein N-acetyltransferase
VELLTSGKGLALAIERREDQQLLGTVGFKGIDRTSAQAELGFWIGVEYWGRGYATEAALALLSYGFGTLGLNRVYDHHMVRNPASGRELAKIGMRVEGGRVA